jgi:hypothetical protein
MAFCRSRADPAEKSNADFSNVRLVGADVGGVATRATVAVASVSRAPGGISRVAPAPVTKAPEEARTRVPDETVGMESAGADLIQALPSAGTRSQVTAHTTEPRLILLSPVPRLEITSATELRST